MTNLKDRCFQDSEGKMPANVGDKVGLVLDANKLVFCTIVFNYGNDGQQYLTEGEKGRLCFVGGHENYKVELLKIFTSYAQAKEVMDELTKTSFPNEGMLQICSLQLDAIGEPSKGNPEFLGIFA